MMNRLWRRGPIAWAAVLLLAGTTRAQTVTYDFILIADSTGPFEAFLSPSTNSAGTVVFLGGEGLNDSGQLAFIARLADGRQVIVRADPQETVIPEPSTLALLGIGTVGLLGYAWRRRKA